MLPIFFGSQQRRLFGVHEPPAIARRSKARAALVCSSWGTEYIYAHRSIRQLSRRLSHSGFHTLRFDYFGAGDSGGETTDCELRGWKDDILTALSELKDMSGASDFAVLGMRLGATLVAQLASQLPEDVHSIVLWDPIVCGRRYVQALLEGEDKPSQDLPKIGTTGTAFDNLTMYELGGLALSSAFIRGLQEIDLRSQSKTPPQRVLTICTDPDEAPSDAPHFDGETVSLRAPASWKAPADGDEGLPVQVYEEILKWL